MADTHAHTHTRTHAHTHTRTHAHTHIRRDERQTYMQDAAHATHANTSHMHGAVPHKQHYATAEHLKRKLHEEGEDTAAPASGYRDICLAKAMWAAAPRRQAGTEIDALLKQYGQ
jgi:hypothetical protein